MKKEHMIILSLYYTNPKTDPTLIRVPKFCISIDMLQLLLLMEGVFGKSEYKYCVVNKKIEIVPLSDKESEYIEMIDLSNEEYRITKVINVKNRDYTILGDLDYTEIQHYEENIPKAKDNLYFFNILITMVNGTSILTKRENLVYYYLFSNRGGKEFVSYLITMTLYLLIAYRDAGCESAKQVIEALNYDYTLMKEIYNNSRIVLSEMSNRERRMRLSYKPRFFINQSNSFKEWIRNHQSIIEKKNILEFIFYQNNTLKNYALHFMRYIVRIGTVLIGRECGTFPWEKESEIESVTESRDFYDLNKSIKELEVEGVKLSFDKGKWIEQYIGNLYSWVKVNGFI